MSISKKPIAFFDLETTGTDVAKDRVVQLAAMKVDTSFNIIAEPKVILINPQMPIPAGATKVHGITTEMIANEKTFASYAKSLQEYFKGCNPGGFNCVDFDIPLLAEEFARCGIANPFDEDVVFYDGMQIFHKEEPRNLTGAVKFYLNETLEGAHDAGVDIFVTFRVFKQQLLHYPKFAEMDDVAFDAYIKDGKKMLDLAGKLYLNEQGVACYSFGTKTKDVPVLNDPGFGEWMLKNSFPTNTKEVLKKILYAKR